jgi:hypothetical protein
MYDTASRCLDGKEYCRGPGQVLDHFLPSGPGLIRSAAE